MITDYQNKVRLRTDRVTGDTIKVSNIEMPQKSSKKHKTTA